MKAALFALALVAAALLGSPRTASAAPVGLAPIAHPASSVEKVHHGYHSYRRYKHRHWHYRRAWRYRSIDGFVARGINPWVGYGYCCRHYRYGHHHHHHRRWHY